MPIYTRTALSSSSIHCEMLKRLNASGSSRVMNRVLSSLRVDHYLDYSKSIHDHCFNISTIILSSNSKQ